MISAEASFSRLSPSSSALVVRGILTKRVTAPTLTASGGLTMPPSRKPSASVKPGITWLVTTATAIAVKKTTRKAKLVITRRQRHSSFHEMDQAASNSSGGSTRKKIRSGSTRMRGSPGMKLTTSPATTSMMGYATRSLPASMCNSTTAATMASRKGSNVCMGLLWIDRN